MTNFLFRHDNPRKFQSGLMEDVYSTISSGNNMLAHAPTGSGKTDASLSAALTHAVNTDLTVFFLTPKISQHKIALDVVNGIAKKHKVDIRSVDLVGRRHMCLYDVSELDSEGFYYFCENKRKRKSCEFYNNVRNLDFSSEKKLEKIIEEYGCGMGHIEAAEFAFSNAMCPYELLLRIAGQSNVIIGDYYHFMIPKIRNPILMKTGKQIEDSIVIIDEAHNLANRVRDYLSLNVTSRMLMRAEKEMGMFGFEGEDFAENFDEWAHELLGKKDEVVIEKKDFSDFISQFSDEFLLDLEDTGISYVELKGKKSAALKVSLFISVWENEIETVRILKKNEYGIKLSSKILDPSVITGTLNETYSSVLMSGTLLPLEMHRDVLGLDKQRTLMKTYPSPFPADNILNVVSTNTTTRYRDRTAQNYMKMADEIKKIVGRTPGGSAVFFPSYKVMREVTPFLDIKNMHIQETGMKPFEVRKLIEKFKGEGGVLCGVQGGSLSEGVDFSGGEIKTVVVVGVGLDEMNAEIEALISFYEKKFGMGWEYAYLYPGTIKALQAAGRARRKETDRVVVVYLDERFKWKNYNWIFDNKRRVVVTKYPERYVSDFWEATYKNLL